MSPRYNEVVPSPASGLDAAPSPRADVLIVGGGIIGICCAWELAQRGLSVMVIDKRDIGHGCSYGNAGWLTPCFALPLPMPGMLPRLERSKFWSRAR